MYNTVIITYAVSGTDTEGSLIETNGSECSRKIKRSPAKIICKHCNKKPRHDKSSAPLNEVDSHCESADSDLLKPYVKIVDCPPTLMPVSPLKLVLSKKGLNSKYLPENSNRHPIGRCDYSTSD